MPTILYFLKQTVDPPVSRRGGVEGQQGFPPGQSSSSSAGRGRSGGLRGSFPGQGSLQRTGEQIADIPVPSGRRHGLSREVLPGEPDASECEGAWALIRAERSSNPSCR